MPLKGSKDLLIRLDADPKGFIKGMKSAQAETRAFERELARKEAALAKMHSEMEGVGQGVLLFGGAVAAGLGLAAKAAIDWESAWTGVTKTVDGSPEQMAALEEELRALTKILPTTHTEIAAVAEAAGQLGIKRKDIVGFTKVMIDLGNTTNLTADQAAMSLAKMMNIMQTAPEDVGRLASTLVDLGNKGASTEADIMEMGMRIAGAGHQIGLSEAEVLAFAGTLSSLGVEAEAGGSAISTVFVKMQTAVSDGGDSLASFARVAGMTSAEFSAAFRDDAAGAIDAVVVGLGRMQRSGVDLFGVLDELGIKEIRQRDAMLRMAGAGNLLTDQLGIANAEWEDSNALLEEAGKRYATTESQMAIARNQVNDFAISMGETLLPVIGSVVGFLGGLADTLNDLPGPVKTILAVLAGLVAVIGVVGGAAMIAVPKMVAFNEALSNMNSPVARGAQKALSGTASFLMGPWGIALGVAVTAIGIFTAAQAESRARIEGLADTLDDQTGALTDNSRAWLVNELEKSGALKAAQDMGIETTTLVDAIMGEQDALDELNAVYDEHLYRTDETGKKYTLSGEAAGKYRDQAATLSNTIAMLSGDLEEAKTAAERKAEAMVDAEAKAEAATDQEKLFAESMGLSADMAGEAKDAISELSGALDQLLTSLFGVDQAERAVADAIAAATEKAAEHGATLDESTDAGRRNEEAIEGVIGSMFDLIEAEAEAGASTDELSALTRKLKKDFIEQMRQAGFAEDEIQEYAKAFDDIPSTVTSILELEKKVTGGFGGGGGGHKQQFFHDGGPISGPPGRDQVPVMAENGEFIINARATNRNRPLLEAINSGRTPRLPAGAGGGGAVQVMFDFTGIDSDMARALRKTVLVEGAGNVQLAFGKRGK